MNRETRKDMIGLLVLAKNSCFDDVDLYPLREDIGRALDVLVALVYGERRGPRHDVVDCCRRLCPKKMPLREKLKELESAVRDAATVLENDDDSRLGDRMVGDYLSEAIWEITGLWDHLKSEDAATGLWDHLKSEDAATGD